MSKMTDKEIIKALECIQPRILTEKERKALDNALDLINRQQEKIEYMQGEREILLEDMQVRNNQVIEQQAEIEEKQKLIDNLHEVNEKLYEEMSERQKEEVSIAKRMARAKAIKEYMKILEEKLSQNTDISNVGYQSIIFDMEQGYKEMVGEGK